MEKQGFVEIRKPERSLGRRCQWTRGNFPVRNTYVMKWHWGPPASKMSNLRLSKWWQAVSLYLYYSENLQ